MKITSEAYAIVVLATLGWSFAQGGDSELGMGSKNEWPERRRPAQVRQSTETKPAPEVIENQERPQSG